MATENNPYAYRLQLISNWIYMAAIIIFISRGFIADHLLGPSPEVIWSTKQPESPSKQIESIEKRIQEDLRDILGRDLMKGDAWNILKNTIVEDEQKLKELESQTRTARDKISLWCSYAFLIGLVFNFAAGFKLHQKSN